MQTSPRTKAFTLIKLLVVISIIALLIGILLPALGGARDAARQMKSSTQLRSIVQAMIIHAGDNSGLYPGVDDFTTDGRAAFTDLSEIPNYTDVAPLWAGSQVPARFILMFEGGYLADPSIAISPAEGSDGLDVVETYDPQVANPYTENSVLSSYALPRIRLNTSNSGSGVMEGRLFEWSDTLNSRAIVVSDRLAGRTSESTVGVPETHFSLWSRDSWSGGLGYNDGHVEFSNTSEVENTSYAGSEVAIDNLFFGPTDTFTSSGQFSDNFSNAVMVNRAWFRQTAAD